MKKARRLTPLLVALALATVALAACGSDENDDGDATSGAVERTQDAGQGGSSPESQGKESQGKPVPIPTIVIKGGEPVGGVAELEYDAGDEVRFKVESDVADEVHVHGYDLSEEVPAGGSVSFDFPAEIEGIFEVELEERVEQIAELRVNP